MLNLRLIINYILSIILFNLIVSCNNVYKVNNISKQYNDTIIIVDSLNYILSNNNQKNKLSAELAHKVLLNYFQKKTDYYPEEMMPLDSLLAHDFDDDHMPMCISFDTLYTIHLNRDKIVDGIITYWDMPCGANGNNWRPHKAMITSINNKYTVINTDFIPDYFLIDSISQDYNNTYIYIKEFDEALAKLQMNIEES